MLGLASISYNIRSQPRLWRILFAEMEGIMLKHLQFAELLIDILLPYTHVFA